MNRSSLLICCALTFLACDSSQTPSNSNSLSDGERKPYYAIWDDPNGGAPMRSVSLLLAMDTKGQLNVCIKGDGKYTPTAEEISQIKTFVDQGVNAWNELLNRPAPASTTAVIFPEWKRKIISFSFNCDLTPDLTIEVNNTAPTSYGDMPGHKILFLNKHVADGTYTITHELGHLCGLGDTYTLSGYQVPDDQPVGIMNDNSQTCTADDQAAIWNAWRYIKFGGDPCGPGYKTGTAEQNPFSFSFCVSTNPDPSQVSKCTYSCEEFGYKEGDCKTEGSYSYRCRKGCIIGAATCNLSCQSSCFNYGLSEGQCMASANGAWKCDAGCMVEATSCSISSQNSQSSQNSPSNCEYKCADYEVSEGECKTYDDGSSFKCTNGCLNYVELCS